MGAFEAWWKDTVLLLKEQAREAKQKSDAASPKDRDYEMGRLMAYGEVISLLKQQATSFGVDAGLADIDPERDLL